MSCCPRCGYHFEEELGLERLRLHAGELGIFVDAEDTVDVVGAARLIGLSEKTMRNMRSEMRGPEYAKRGGRVRYMLANLLPLVLCLSLGDQATRPTIASDDLTYEDDEA